MAITGSVDEADAFRLRGMIGGAPTAFRSGVAK